MRVKGRRWSIGLAVACAALLAAGCSDADSEVGDSARTDQEGDAGTVLTVRPVISAEPSAGDDCDPSRVRAAAASAPTEACGPDDERFDLAPAILTDRDVASAGTREDPMTGNHFVTLEFTAQGGQEFHRFTSENTDERVAFVVEGDVVSAPLIKGATPPSAPTTLAGDFSEAQARHLADTLN